MNRRLMGLAFPFRIVRGGVQTTVDSEKIQANLRQLLMTRLGERLMRRNYGVGLYSLVQEPNDAALAARVRYEIETALANFMPEVRLVGAVSAVNREEQLRIAFEYVADPQQVVRRLELSI